MKQMTLEHICAACGGTFFGTEEHRQIEIRGGVQDSRQIDQDYLFFAVKGERVDGHKFLAKVFEQGAAAAVVEYIPEDVPGCYILVESTLQALKDIAAYYRSVLDIKFVGITGSVGKTSTKEMISAVLGQKYNVLKTAGNFNNEVGLPLTILRIREEHQVAVVEMGISDFGEMHRLAAIAKPDICVITNIGLCHLENLKTRDGILKAKSEIFDFLKPDGAIVLNGDDDKLSLIDSVKGVTPMRYHVCPPDEAMKDDTGSPAEGSHRNTGYEVTASGVENLGLKGMAMTLNFPEESISVREPIPGAHNVCNALAAACVGRVMGLTNREIVQGISGAKTIDGRTNLMEIGDLLVIDDCYNANPVSMKAALDVLQDGLKRKIAVLGDMGELGENEAALHAGIGAYAAEKDIDVLFCAGDLCRHMAETAKKGGMEVHYFADRNALTSALLEYLQPGDTVLIKASHFMEYPKIITAIREAYAKS